VIRLRDSSLVDLVPTADFVKAGGITSGVFAWPKDADVDRFIVNAVFTNDQQWPPDKVVLPRADIWARLEAPMGQRVFVTKCDLKDFFHSFELPEHLRHLFGLPSVDGPAVGLGTGRFTPVCRTLPMGWSHSVLIAQAAHRKFAIEVVGLDPADEITAENDLRLDRPRWMLYCDDYVIFTPESHLPQGRALLKAYTDALPASGWTFKPSKLVDFTCEPVQVLGYTVTGKNHEVTPSPLALHRVIEDTVRMLQRGTVKGDQLATLLGSWTWLIMLKRSVLSVFDTVYALSDRALESRETLFLLPDAALELRAVIALAPLLRASIGHKWAPEVYASDASTAGCGVTSAPLDLAWVDPFARHPWGQGPRGGLRRAHRAWSRLGLGRLGLA
jgi:hypothetical protein